MIKKIAIIIAVFGLGFFTHALLVPNLFSQTPDLEATKAKILGDKTDPNTPDSTVTNKSLTITSFKNEKFHPSKIFMKQGYYIGIKNDDPDHLMWLLSETKELTTPRGYGLSEQIKQRMDKKGEFVVYEKNSEAPLTIVVQ